MHLLVVEDDETIKTGLKQLLTNAGYTVDLADGLAAWRKLRMAGTSFQAYLIDIMLSDGSGLELCRMIRKEEDTPILFLTALDDEKTVIEALGAGADDYIPKPFRAGELLARLEANLRRTSTQNYSIESGEVLYRFPEERVFLSGREIFLRRNEQKLLRLLLESGGRLLRRDYVLYYMWDSEENFVEENTLSVLVFRLRKALGKYKEQEYIETVRGVGYRWRFPCTTKGNPEKGGRKND